MTEDGEGQAASGSWSYESGSDVALVISVPREDAGADVTFVAVVVLAISTSRERLKQVSVLAAPETELAPELDWQTPPGALAEKIQESLGRADNPAVKEVSSRVRSRLKNYFSTELNLRSIARDLRDGRLFEVKEQVREAVNKKLLEAIPDEVRIRISDWGGQTEKSGGKVGVEKTPSAGGAEAGSERNHDKIAREIEQTARHVLQVEPCIDPVKGNELSELNLNDEVMIRVVGEESVRKINSALVDEDSPEKYPVSRPLPARVAALKLGPERGEMKFWTELKDSVYGRGVQPSRARVRLHRTASSKAEFFNTVFIFSLSL